MEIAELASMSMELFTMEHWDVFYQDETELKRAKIEEAGAGYLSVCPGLPLLINSSIGYIPTRVTLLRNEKASGWNILQEFSTGKVDWTGFEEYRRSFWQKQLHLYEVPFYYIEYGIAQLGAIAMWRQYRGNAQQALDNYCKALSLGYTRTLKELYDTAGIRFDFSPQYVAELGGFIREALRESGVQ